ncbi:alpha/beta hydrolase [Mycolicibacterium alvei]|nr:alpha/beta hydrolase [Mycolicibacterium alvei]
MRSVAKWIVRARATDYVVALATSYGSIPLVGRYLQPFGGAAAVGVWGYRHAPDFLAAAVRSRLTQGAGELRQRERDQTRTVAEAVLDDITPGRTPVEWPAPDRVAPLFKAGQHRGQYLYRRSVPYGESPGQVLDVWRRRDLPAEPAPVLVFVPGGAWVYGSRVMQGYALMSHLAERGWICLSIDYRVAPQHRWPTHLLDVNAAVAWARANAQQFGGDTEFVAIAGCSAGGHLSALAALSADDPRFRGDLPADAKTSVDAVVSMYGRYDWEDRSTPERDTFVDFLERVVVRRRYARHRDIFRSASPIARVRPDAPPFLVVHGTADTVIPIWQARAFVDKLRGASQSVVGYLELPGAHHGFDMTDATRTATAATVIGIFLEKIRQSHVERTAQQLYRQH